MEKDTATPRPWNLETKQYQGHKSKSGGWAGRVTGPEGEIVYAGPFSFWSLKGQANAQLIVKAVNSHEQMVAALKAIQEQSMDEWAANTALEALPAATGED